MAQYPDTFELALTAADVRGAISRGKVASLLGVEGYDSLIWNPSHQLTRTPVPISSVTRSEVSHSTLDAAGADYE